MTEDFQWRLLKNDFIIAVKEDDNTISFSELARCFGVSRQHVHAMYRKDHNKVDFPARIIHLSICKHCGNCFKPHAPNRPIHSVIYCDLCAEVRKKMWCRSLMIHDCLGCGTTSRKHRSFGYCGPCYLRKRYASSAEVRRKQNLAVIKWQKKNKEKVRGYVRKATKKYNLKKAENLKNNL